MDATAPTNAATPDDRVRSLRVEQGRLYEAERFAEYFAVSDELAAASTGFARSYEYWLHTAFRTLSGLVAAPRFLQIGAMDGKRFDPIYAFVKHYGWTGLILEPLAEPFAALSTHYAELERVRLMRAAITETDGPREMLRVDRAAVASGAVPIWAEGLGSLHPERNALGGVGVDAELHAALLRHSRHETVDGLTLRSLGEQWDLRGLHVLQVDAEGCELDILRQADALGLRPHAVHLEHWALGPADRGALFGLLAERGYVMRAGESDVLAVDPFLRAAIDGACGWSC